MDLVQVGSLQTQSIWNMKALTTPVIFFAILATYLMMRSVYTGNYSPVLRHVLRSFGNPEKTTLESLSFQCNHPKPQLKRISQPFPAMVVQTCGHIVDRIRQFNVALDSIRIDKLKNHKKTTDWNVSSSENLTLLAEWKDGYFQALSNFSQVTLVVLPWLRNPHKKANQWSSLHDDSNLPVREYYESTGSDPLCKWIETPGIVGFSFDVINNWTCNRNTTKATVPQSISLLALNAKAPYKNYYYPSMYPESFFTELPSVLYSLYIVETGIIHFNGDVFIKNAKIVPYGCFPETSLKKPTEIHTFPVYDEVLVITQTFGDRNYHRLAETFPRIAVLLDFLKRNPNIKIHMPTRFERLSQYLTMFGIDASRVIHGWCRAEIVYLPRAIQCCLPNFLESQFLSRLFRRYIKENLQPVLRNKIVVIRRSNFRSFHDQNGVEAVVRKAAVDYNLTYETFHDNPLPSITDMMRLFNSALMVVAPHGAGLGNLVFSDPGTFVIEGVCNPPTAHLFFQRTALIFGHRYHGIPSSGGCWLPKFGSVRGVVTIKPSVIDEIVRTYLKFLASRRFANDTSKQ